MLPYDVSYGAVSAEVWYFSVIYIVVAPVILGQCFSLIHSGSLQAALPLHELLGSSISQHAGFLHKSISGWFLHASSASSSVW